MGHPDQHTPDDHRSSKRDDAPEPDLDDDITEDLDPDARREIKERATTGTNPRADEPDDGDEQRRGEYGHAYMGRQMDDSLKGPGKRPRDEDELAGEPDD